MGNIGFGELAIICIVLIIAVGPERLPSMMKTLGKTIRTLRQASRDIRASTGIDELMRDDFDIHPAPRRPYVQPPAPPPPIEGPPVGRDQPPVVAAMDATYAMHATDATDATDATTAAQPATVDVPAVDQPLTAEPSADRAAHAADPAHGAHGSAAASARPPEVSSAAPVPVTDAVKVEPDPSKHGA